MAWAKKEKAVGTKCKKCGAPLSKANRSPMVDKACMQCIANYPEYFNIEARGISYSKNITVTSKFPMELYTKMIKHLEKGTQTASGFVRELVIKELDKEWNQKIEDMEII